MRQIVLCNKNAITIKIKVLFKRIVLPAKPYDQGHSKKKPFVGGAKEAGG